VTLSPVNSLEPLLNQIGVKWALARTSGTGHGSVVQIEGLEWTIGTDWIVRVGKVIQIGGGVRGMVIEVRLFIEGAHPYHVLTRLIKFIRQNIYQSRLLPRLAVGP
jgi:hypothetical protein